MQIVRTIIWVLLLVALLIFCVANWDPIISVKIWEGLRWDTRLPAVVIASFLVAFVPMWLLQLGTKWHHKRQISALDNKLNAANAIIAQMTAAALPQEVEVVPAIIEVGPEVAPLVVEPSEEPLVDAPAPVVIETVVEPRPDSSERKFLRDDPAI